MSLSTSDFGYHLPQKLVAQEPASPRDSARLMLVNRTTRQISHHHVYDLPRLLPSNYDLVANNTKVFPARIIGHKPTGGQVEILLLKKLGSGAYETITSPGLKLGQKVELSSSLNAEVIVRDDRLTTLSFSLQDPMLTEELARLGSMPTPPYIKKMIDNPADYQTIYAKYGFSAAAPTAGLHFTNELLNKIKLDHSWIEITLNVGLGTFLPVKVKSLVSHHMHTEDYSISPSASKAIHNIHAQSRKLLAVGTTTVRCLESSLGETGRDSTDIFIYPPRKFELVDALLTNFHLPHSTLLMLVSAFASYPQTANHFTSFEDSLIGEAYRQAVKHNYRFFSFGDAMLIL